MTRHTRHGESGFTLLEVLVALVILLVGLMGSAGLLVRTVQQEVEAYQRLQALNLLQDMVGRVNANRDVAACYSNGGSGENYGVGAGALADCNITGASTEQEDRAETDMAAWHNLLLGISEQQGTGGELTGAMVGARGCIEQDPADDALYRITVAWQGMSESAAPPAANSCGLNAYGDEKQRRIVSAVVRIGDLT